MTATTDHELDDGLTHIVYRRRGRDGIANLTHDVVSWVWCLLQGLHVAGALSQAKGKAALPSASLHQKNQKCRL